LFSDIPVYSEIVVSHNLPEDDANEEEVEESFAQECQDIRAAMSPQLPPLKLSDDVSKPLGQGTLSIDALDLDVLIKM
jgi:hypothetical protein